MEKNHFFRELQLITENIFSDDELLILRQIPKRFAIDLANLRNPNYRWYISTKQSARERKDVFDQMKLAMELNKLSILSIIEEAQKYYDPKSGYLPKIFSEMLLSTWDSCLDGFYGLIVSPNKKIQDIAFILLTSGNVKFDHKFYQRCSNLDTLYGFLTVSALKIKNKQPISWHKFLKAYILSNVYPNKEKPVVKFFKAAIIEVPKNRISAKINNISWHSFTNSDIENAKQGLL